MSSTPAVYPTSLVTFTTKVNHIDVYNDDDINKMQNEVIALQTYIGTNPHGSRADLTTRIGVMMATDGAIAKGTAFPTNPVEGQEFWRTDLKTLYVYNATISQWASQGQSLSNVVFSYAGIMASTATTPISTPFSISGAVAATFIKTKFYKISGISTVDIDAYLWITSNGDTMIFRTTIGTAAGSASVTQTSPTFKTFTIDVSGLTSGTLYDVIIDTNGGASGTSYIGSLIGIAK